MTVLVILALVGATSCETQPDATRSEQKDGVSEAPARLRFQVVRSILEDSRGNFWFGSWSEGVCRFDGQKYTYFTVEDGLCDNQIRSIQEDQDGVVWFGGGVGISGFAGDRIISRTSVDYTSRDKWRLREGDLWFKEDGSVGATAIEGHPGVYRYDGRTFTYLDLPLSADPLLAFSDREVVTAHAVTGIAKGRSGRLWFATYSEVVGYDGKSFTIIDDESLGLTEDTGRLHVRSVLEDSKGNLWIGNNGIGVLLHDGHTTISFTQEKGLGRMDHRVGRMKALPDDVTDGSPSLHRVFSMGEDRSGNIWFGTIEHGAWRYDGKTLRNFGAEDGLTSKEIQAIYTDRRGDLWLAGSGVFKFNGASFDRIH